MGSYTLGKPTIFFWSIPSTMTILNLCLVSKTSDLPLPLFFPILWRKWTSEGNHHLPTPQMQIYFYHLLSSINKSYTVSDTFELYFGSHLFCLLRTLTKDYPFTSALSISTWLFLLIPNCAWLIFPRDKPKHSHYDHLEYPLSTTVSEPRWLELPNSIFAYHIIPVGFSFPLVH